MEPKQIGDRIRQAREDRGLSQEELGVLISRDQRSVSLYESGNRRIYAHDLPTIAAALQVPIMYFYADITSEHDVDEVVSALLNDMPPDKHQITIEIMKLLRKLAGS